MKKLCLYLSCILAVATRSTIAQDLRSHIQTLKTSYSGSGSIIEMDSHTLVIEPKMPGPLCALPKTQGGKTIWSYYAFPLSSITVPLALVDETLIGEDTVFTNPEAAKAYKPGDVGDTTMVVIVGVPGKKFHTLTYDRDKLEHLGPGPHSGSAYGEEPDDVEAFGLIFADHDDARAFEAALRYAVLIAKGQTARN